VCALVAARKRAKDLYPPIHDILQEVLAEQAETPPAFRQLASIRHFDLFLIMTQGGPGDASYTLSWQIYVETFRNLKFGIGAALYETGLARAFAETVVGLAGGSPWGTLVAIYLVTAIFTAVITNNAAAVLMIPIALSAADSLGVAFLPYAVTIMVAASASFMTPIGYQTNLLVYGPGGYRFVDYVKAGLPMSLITGLIAVFVIPMVWPF
jgi:hypothetical protein